MSTDQPNSREGVLAGVIAALRSLNRQAVLFTDAVADRLGIAGTDVECLEVLVSGGSVTAGQLADATGLSTGAVTRMVDRLVQSGYVRRNPDPTDRRRVIVEITPERADTIRPLFASLETAIRAGIDRYSDEQLAVALDVVQTALEVTRAETANAREADVAPTGDRARFSAPLGSTTVGRLVFLSGFSDLAMGAESRDDRLFSSSFAGSPPRIRVRGGVVSIRATRSPLDWLNPRGEFQINASVPFNFDLRGGISKVKAEVSPRVQVRRKGGDETGARGEVLLNRTIPWDIDIHGGLSRLSADLRGVQLRSLDITGGASATTVLLPAPRGWSTVKLVGGASDVTLRRPTGTALRLHVRGGISNLDFDNQHVSAMGSGEMRLEGTGSGDAGYDVEIVGGASRFRIDTVAAVTPGDA
jgi:DNA-binding MarR family transcriptional regulator